MKSVIYHYLFFIHLDDASLSFCIEAKTKSQETRIQASKTTKQQSFTRLFFSCILIKNRIVQAEKVEVGKVTGET
jgi:hypothetical protein